MDGGARAVIEKVRDSAASSGDEQLATAAWILLTIADAQNAYVAAVDAMRGGKFYAAWCALEQCEQRLHELDYHFREKPGEYGIDFMRKQTAAFQDLYPYGIFASPEFVYKRILCGICNAPVTPRNRCGHAKWGVYGGRMYLHRIEDVEIAAVAIVTHPVQKYSVMGVVGDDHDTSYNHAYASYIAKALESPWDGWKATKTKIRHPHSHFATYKAEGPCPCESTKTYAECCLPESGVLRPHLEVRFDKAPRAGTPPLHYSNPA